MPVTLVDSPVANVANIRRALAEVGAEPLLSADPATIAAASKLVLPGVGSFAAAMKWLDLTGVGDALREAAGRGVPLLGICVGHQVLFDDSDEDAAPGTIVKGLGLFRGSIQRFDGHLPVPQIGWNAVSTADTPGVSRRAGMPALQNPARLFEGISDGTAFYFVNSYRAADVEATVATAEYSGRFTAAAQQGNIYGVQFHPEKSSTAGLRVLRNFVEVIG
jgi:glutamine amidotransferase